MRAPAGHRGFLADDALSPDGAWLATFVAGSAGPMHAFRPGSRQAIALRIPGSTSFTVFTGATR